VPYDNPAISDSDLLLDAICPGDADALWFFDCEKFEFKTWTYLDKPPGWVVRTGMPFWVNITGKTGCYWSAVGLLDTTISYKLCAGMNLVSLPVYTTSIASGKELLADIPGCNAVFRWKKTVSCDNFPGFNGYFLTSDPSENFSVFPGYSYWVNVVAPVEWIPSNP